MAGTRQLLAVLALLMWVIPASAQVISTPSPTPKPLRSVRSPTPTPIPPGRVHVEVTLTRGRDRLPGDDTVAWLPDISASGAATEDVRIAQRKKQFEPRVAVVSIGSTVDFPNFDRVFHNVFSLSTPKSFDLGLYRKGKSKAVRFEHPGLVQVYCNIHPHMAAYLMIVDSDRHGVADQDGVITLNDVPSGRYTVEGWNVRSGMWTRTVMVRPGRTSRVAVELDISSWRDMPHLNKHGREYPPPDDDDFRY